MWEDAVAATRAGCSRVTTCVCQLRTVLRRPGTCASSHRRQPLRDRDVRAADDTRLCTGSCCLPPCSPAAACFWACSSLFGKDADLEQLYAGVNFSRSVSTIIASWGDATYALAPHVSNGTRVCAVLNVRVLCHRRKRRLPKGVKPTPAFEALLKTYDYSSCTLPRAVWPLWPVRASRSPPLFLRARITGLISPDWVTGP